MAQAVWMIARRINMEKRRVTVLLQGARLEGAVFEPSGLKPAERLLGYQTF
jgi:hypothetical protein